MRFEDVQLLFHNVFILKICVLLSMAEQCFFQNC